MRFRQRLYWIITCRWFYEWWIGPRAVALANITDKHKKCSDALNKVHTSEGTIEGQIVTLESEIAKAERPDRAKLYELRSKRAELAKLRKREKVLTDRVDELGEMLSRFELDDDYMPLSEHDQQVVRSVSDRLMKQGDEAQVDAGTMADTASSIAEAIDSEGLDEELAELSREVKAKHAPKAVEPPEALAKIVPLYPKEKPKDDAERLKEDRDVAARAEAVARKLEKAEPDPNAGFVIMPDDEPPPTKERELDFG